MNCEKNVFTGKYVQVTLEERGAHTYERVYLRPGITVIPMTSDSEVLCVKEKDWNTGVTRIKLVSGYVNDGEHPLDCAMRELSEEIGVTAESWDMVFRATSEEATVQKTQYFYLARGLTIGQAHPDSEEDIFGLVKIPFHEIYEMAHNGSFGTGSTALALLRMTCTEKL